MGSHSGFANLSVPDFGAKDVIPEFVADAESDGALLVVVQHVVPLEVFEVEVFGSCVVQVVVDHVVEDVPEEFPCRYCVQVGLRDYIRHRDYNEDEVNCEAWKWWKYELESIHRKSVMNPVQHEMKSQYFGVLGQPRVFRMEKESVQIIFRECPPQHPHYEGCYLVC